METWIRPTWAEVDLKALASNLEVVRRMAARAEVLAVVKANAYGHGAVPVARALEAAGVKHLGVALVEEGVELRQAGFQAEILVLGGAYEGGYGALIEHRLTPTLFRREHLEALSEAAGVAGRTVQAHVKVDTGMGRIGVQPEELDPFLAAAARVPRVKLVGLASHFANADLADAELTDAQVQRFKAALHQMRVKGMEPAWRHLANSAGVIDRPDVRDGLELNMVRPGIMLYGVRPAPRMEVALSPVLSWKTRVIHLKRVPVGTPISYGSTWRASRPSDIATLPVGYADGYSRGFSSKAPVLIRGRRAQVVGRVCMDMCMVDVTDVAGAQVGDEVVLLGAQGAERVGAEELAQVSGTIPYEILCAISARVPRTFD